MKLVDEYRDPAAVLTLAAAIRSDCTRPWTLMEICGGQTHAILKFGLDQLLPPGLRLVHGPGCPVCVTGIEIIDRAVAIASRPGVTFCSFGDMLRVPGTSEDLLSVKARGGDVRIVYSPLDAVRLAMADPGRNVVFFAVGFETTAPGNAAAVKEAARLGLRNFSVLVAHVLVPPALEVLLAEPSNEVQGLLAPGHVCTVMGTAEYARLAERFGVPIVVTGFEPTDILRGILACVRQLEAGEASVENAYARVVLREGNRVARAVMEEVFEVADRPWRGIGILPRSGLVLRKAFAAFDAERVYGVESLTAQEPAECQAGLVLQGRLEPTGCAAFGVRCTPERPLGAPMVSSEGACAAYFQYRRGAAEIAG